MRKSRQGAAAAAPAPLLHPPGSGSKGRQRRLEALAAFKRLFSELFNHILFYRYLDHEKRVQAVLRTLPALTAIDEKVEEGAIEREKAHQLKEALTKALEKMLYAGVITPDIKESAIPAPEALLAPTPTRLLAPPSEGGPKKARTRRRARRSNKAAGE